MNLMLIGCSHRTASVDLRERLAFNSQQAVGLLADWRARFPDTEAVLLSTCNRVEVYTASEQAEGGPSHEEVASFLAESRGLNPLSVFDSLIQRSGEAAVRHLFTVAASLDSMVLGEPQILSQVKQAYQLAQEQQSAGPITHEAFQAALRVAKRVTSETSINERRVSVASVAVADFAREIFERFDDKRVLVIGAGEMAVETLRYLREEGARDVTVVNRCLERAEALAIEFNGSTAPWERLDDLLSKADLIVSTTGSAEPIVTLKRFQAIEARRYQRPLFILDLAVPRDFEPGISDCLGVYLYSVDDLEAACARNRQARDKELPTALAIIEAETARFMADLHHRATGPIIQRLRQDWEAVREQELRRLFSKLPALNEGARAEIVASFERYANKLLHPPLESLRDESRHGAPHGLLDALKRLFKLQD